MFAVGKGDEEGGQHLGPSSRDQPLRECVSGMQWISKQWDSSAAPTESMDSRW